MVASRLRVSGRNFLPLAWAFLHQNVSESETVRTLSKRNSLADNPALREDYFVSAVKLIIA